MNINYSVIIPFRDCLEMLRTACSSIPNRDDIQVIVVDNALTPIGSEALADFPNKNLMYLISSPTKGAGCARNVGMDHAQGKYLLFLDADDYFTPNAFEAFDKELNTDVDIIYFNATSINLTTGNSSNRHRKIAELINKSIRDHNEDILRYCFINPVCKMIKRELVVKHNIKFQEVRVANDQMFSTWTGHYAESIKANDTIVYVITEGEAGSSLTLQRSAENQFLRYKVAIEHYKFVHSVGHPDMAFSLKGFLWMALKNYGIKECYKWIIYTINNITKK